MKTYRTTIYKTDAEKFNESILYSRENDFVEGYITKHKEDGVESAADVYSLLLSYAISQGEIGMIENIFKSNNSADIFLSADKLGNVPIVQIIKSNNQEVREAVGQHLQKNQLVKHEANIEADLRSPLIKALQDYATVFATPELNCQTFIAPLLDEGCYAELHRHIKEMGLFDQPLY